MSRTCWHGAKVSTDKPYRQTHSCRSATTGSRRAALLAGHMPKKRPTATETTIPVTADHKGTPKTLPTRALRDAIKPTSLRQTTKRFYWPVTVGVVDLVPSGPTGAGICSLPNRGSICSRLATCHTAAAITVAACRASSGTMRS